MDERQEVTSGTAATIARQEGAQRAYCREYEAWIESLPEAEREALPEDLREPLPIRDSSAGSRTGAPGESTHIGFVVRVSDNGRTSFEEAEHATPPEDSVADQLREVANLDAEQAEVVAGWVAENSRRIALEQASDFLADFLENIINPEGPINLSVVAQKTIALRFMLGRRRESLTDLAKRAQVSKQLVSYHGRTLETALGRFHGVLQKRRGAVESYAAAMRESWQGLTPDERIARRHGKKATAPQATPATHLTISEVVKCEPTSPAQNSAAP